MKKRPDHYIEQNLIGHIGLITKEEFDGWEEDEINLWMEHLDLRKIKVIFRKNVVFTSGELRGRF